MTREKKIEILMGDFCSRSEAEKYLQNGTVIFEEVDFVNNFDYYMEEWGIPTEDIPAFKKMIDSKNPLTDWGVVIYEGQNYYIQYCL